MAKYGWKVYFTDGQERIVYWKEFAKANLQDMDLFTLEHPGLELQNILAEQLSISMQQIKEIKIFQVRRQTEFSICLGNRYLNPILQAMKKDSSQIPTSHEVYQEMKRYLFANLEEKNYENFLDNVYTYRNQFSSLLERYCDTFHQPDLTEEENHELSILKKEIEEKLKIYKNYRSLCVSRQKAEDFDYSFFPSKNVKKIKINSNISPGPYHFSKTAQPYPFLSSEKKTADYNREHDEFLSPEEYERMQQEDDPYQYR